VIYMSAFTGESLDRDDPGAAFLQKPFTLETLVRTVRALLAPAT
jgi:hypothetical protein